MSGRIIARPLTAAAFAPYGEILRLPEAVGRRDYFDTALANLRTAAHASLSLVLAAHSPEVAESTANAVEAGIEDIQSLVEVSQFERHAFSSQSFIPMAACRWVVVVAPHAPAGGPDMARASAFLPAPDSGVTLHGDVWHAPLTVLDAPAPFAILMWRDGGSGDEEFAPITPFFVDVGTTC